MNEKPLHVRVAEALGWTKVQHYWQNEPDLKAQFPEPHFGIRPEGGQDNIPRYDTDWSATGPLIERYKIELTYLWPGDWGGDGFRWAGIVRAGREGLPLIEGETPLTAVCNLILVLHAAGKLAA